MPALSLCPIIQMKTDNQAALTILDTRATLQQLKLAQIRKPEMLWPDCRLSMYASTHVTTQQMRFPILNIWSTSQIFHWHATRKTIFQLDAYVVQFYGMSPKQAIFFSCGLAEKKNQQSPLFRIILPTFVTIIIYKDNFFQKYIWRCLKNTMNSSQKCWPSLIIKSYHNGGFWQAVIIILLLSASVREGITFSTGAKAFVNFQKTILKWRFCMLFTNCKQEHTKDLKRTLCTQKSHANTFRKLVFQKSHFCSSIMTKILQPPKMSKKKNNRRYLGLM